MRLYSGSSTAFMDDTVHNRIADQLRAAFFDHFRYNPPQSELNSWRNSLRAVSLVFDAAGLRDHGVILEYQLPMTSKRLDCLVTGEDPADRPNAVILELKQWDSCLPAEGENEVAAWVGGAQRELLHPSVQVGQYLQYLRDGHTAFHDGTASIRASACAYLHNYTCTPDDPLLASKFATPMREFPLFAGDQVDPLCEYLTGRLERGQGMRILERIESEPLRPSRKLMEHVAEVIASKPAYVLLDEQLVVFDKVLAVAKSRLKTGRKSVILVKGGPGTGKSVIAINLMARLLREGFNAQYATGSKAFTETLRKIIGSRGSVQFKYFNSYTRSSRNDIDVLIADEAHRIRETSESRFTPKANRQNVPQLKELIDVARLPVFLIDDFQVVRPNELGSADYIRKYSADSGCDVYEYELEAQFRCSGSDAFVNWVNNTLGVRRTANVIWDRHEEFEFKIFEDPFSLEAAIREKADAGHSARLTAGFCWKWSLPDDHGYLKDDVVIGDFRRPWDAKPEAKKLARGIPRASLWAHDPNGINQVGCVYTAQGFEFDYVGVIFGEDLVWDPREATWLGVREKSADVVVKRAKEGFTDLVKNTYRVLLSRGMKGCYVYFMNPETRNFFKSRME